METLRPVIEVGDIIVMDNLAVHHYDGGEILEDFLSETGIKLIYTPVYSPDLNPIEMCFNKVKTSLNQDFFELVHSNVKLASSYAVETITESDMRGFFRHTSYLFDI
jgi:transposase